MYLYYYFTILFYIGFAILWKFKLRQGAWSSYTVQGNYCICIWVRDFFYYSIPKTHII